MASCRGDRSNKCSVILDPRGPLASTRLDTHAVPCTFRQIAGWMPTVFPWCLATARALKPWRWRMSQVALDAHARSLATGPPTPSPPSADEAVPSENSRINTCLDTHTYTYAYAHAYTCLYACVYASIHMPVHSSTQMSIQDGHSHERSGQYGGRCRSVSARIL